MRVVATVLTLLSLCAILISPQTAEAIPAITCHCFTERGYEPSRPAAADPYYLASTQNTFFSIIFKTDKKSLVMKKQKGSSGDDLWVAYWLAVKTGSTADRLLDLKEQTAGSWKAVVSESALSLKAAGQRFSAALAANLQSNQLAECVVDEVFLSRKLLDERELADLRKGGVTNQELIISTLIARKQKHSAKQIYLEIKGGKKSWGALLTDAGVDAVNLESEIKNTLLRGVV
ncbi:MAG: hypothetical protein PHN84_14010 [Desulfuromonadaceae bacterium]|nr:hypothetical protein [Desulfuromonadaceae bacterium]MDD2854999.1 hypothetical protein [Desulfuromonadaceae bacterium]